MKENVIVVGAYWKDHNYKPSLVVLWSDYTWETFESPIGNWDLRDKTVKQYVNINYMISRKASKEETIVYINQKMKELGA